MREELRNQLHGVQRALVQADEAGNGYEAQKQRARLQDLLDMASRHGIDATEWVEPTLLTSLRQAED